MYSAVGTQLCYVDINELVASQLQAHRLSHQRMLPQQHTQVQLQTPILQDRHRHLLSPMLRCPLYDGIQGTRHVLQWGARGGHDSSKGSMLTACAAC